MAWFFLTSNDTAGNMNVSELYIIKQGTPPSTYQEGFSVPSGATKLTASVYWYGVSNASSASISLVTPNGSETTEFQTTTFSKRYVSNVTLPLINYEVILYSGYREMTVTNPAQGSGWKLKVTYTNVTRIDTEIGWS